MELTKQIRPPARSQVFLTPSSWPGAAASNSLSGAEGACKPKCDVVRPGVSGERVQFGAFEFDPVSGELARRDPGSEPAVQRLARQPALLLALLIEKRGGVLSREEIRERIWPGVSVDFESSLHFCIRQIRSALGDSAAEPAYIETLPRRGYRLLPAVESAAAPADPRGAARRGRRRLFAATSIAAALLAGGALLWALLQSPSPPSQERPLRIAIMPFRPPPEWSGAAKTAPIAEWILLELDRIARKRAELVGPTTTIGYGGMQDSLRRLAADYRVEFIVNGRFLDDEGGPRMLAELIRTSDGAHVWVRAYQELGAGQRIGTEIARGVAQELGLQRNSSTRN